MIKAYGMLGELQTAFALLDEGLQQGDLQVSTRVFNHLLIACISDKDAGFKHAIEVSLQSDIGANGEVLVCYPDQMVPRTSMCTHIAMYC